MARPRAYLAIMAARHICVGAYALLAPDSFHGRNYGPVRDLLPLQMWGAVFLIVGLHGVIIVFFGRELHARAVLVASATITAAWAAGQIIAGVAGDLPAPSGPIVWSALVLKDLVVAGMQLRLPVVELPDRLEPHLGPG